MLAAAAAADVAFCKTLEQRLRRMSSCVGLSAIYMAAQLQSVSVSLLFCTIDVPLDTYTSFRVCDEDPKDNGIKVQELRLLATIAFLPMNNGKTEFVIGEFLSHVILF